MIAKKSSPVPVFSLGADDEWRLPPVLDGTPSGAGLEAVRSGGGLSREGLGAPRTSTSSVGGSLSISTISGPISGGGLVLPNVIHGTPGADHLMGGALPETVYLYEGNDSFEGWGGDDTVWGGQGADLVDGGGGADVIYGDLGTDAYLSNSADSLFGGIGNDYLSGDTGNDQLYGGADADTLIGGVGFDSMWGGAGDDIYYVDSAGDSVIEVAGEGWDTVHTSLWTTVLGANVEVLRLGAGAHQGTGNGLDNHIFGNGNGNRLYGSDGNDFLDGGQGADTIYGGADNDTIVGDDNYYAGANDRLYGEQGNDQLYGRIGQDRLDGGTGNDHLDGGDGNDHLIGGLGDDTLYGGDGDDVLEVGMGFNWLDGGSGNDTLRSSEGNDTFYGGFGADRFEIFGTQVCGRDRILDFNWSIGAIQDKIVFKGWFASFGEMLLHSEEIVIFRYPTGHEVPGVLITRDANNWLLIHDIDMRRVRDAEANFEFL